MALVRGPALLPNKTIEETVAHDGTISVADGLLSDAPRRQGCLRTEPVPTRRPSDNHMLW